MEQPEVTNACPPVADTGDDYEIRVKAVASFSTVVAGFAGRNDRAGIAVRDGPRHQRAEHHQREWAPWWGRASRTANCCVCRDRGPGAAFADRLRRATRPASPLRTHLLGCTYSYTYSCTPISPTIFEDEDEDDGTTRSSRQTPRAADFLISRRPPPHMLSGPPPFLLCGAFPSSRPHLCARVTTKPFRIGSCTYGSFSVSSR